MSKGKDIDKQESREQTPLEKRLSEIGENGIDFLSRLDYAVSIPFPLQPDDQPILAQLNSIAALIHSVPYSAIILREGGLYVAQNQDTTRNESEEQLIERLQQSVEYKALAKDKPLPIKVKRFNRGEGNHPDTVAIEFSLQEVPEQTASRFSYLGLAASNTQTPASCSSCGAVIKALNDNGERFKVELSTITNFPSNSNFRIPYIISTRPKLKDSYLDHISDSIKVIEENISPQNEQELYIQYATRESKQQIMEAWQRQLIDEDTKKERMQTVKEEVLETYNRGEADVKEFKALLGEFTKIVAKTKEEIIRSYSPSKIATIAEEKKTLEQFQSPIKKEALEYIGKLSKESQTRLTEQPTSKLPIERAQSLYSFLEEERKKLERQIVDLENTKANNKEILRAADVEKSKIQQAELKLLQFQRELVGLQEKKAAKQKLEEKKKQLGTIQNDLKKAQSDLAKINATEKYQNAIASLSKATQELETKRAESEKNKQDIDKLKKVLTLLEQNEIIKAKIAEKQNFLNLHRGKGAGDEPIVSPPPTRKQEGQQTDFASSSSYSEGNSKSQEGKEKEEKPKTKSLPNSWYNDERVIKILSRNTPNYQVLGVEAGGMDNATVVASMDQLRTVLGRIQQNEQTDVHYVIPMLVNVIDGAFTGRNHWVGLHIRRRANVNTVTYVDPTGRGPSQEIINTVADVLGQNVQVNNLGIPLQWGQVVQDQGAYSSVASWEGNGNDCGPFMIYMLQQLARGEAGERQLQEDQQRIFNADTPLTVSETFGQRLRQEQEQLQNSHLKRSEKLVSKTYDIKESFAAMNPNNTELLDKIRTEAVITADIDLKTINVQNDVTPDKIRKVEFLAEHDHIKDHTQNTKSLIDRIETGIIDQNTVIAIERKSYGQNLGVPDVIMLANIIEHNEKNPDNQLKVPEEITKDSLIYQDAVLYNTAKKHGVKVVGLEGRNLKSSKDSPEEYNEVREDYMASRINQLTAKGYNVIAYVGSAHVDNLKRAVENKPSVESKLAVQSNQVSEELQQIAASIGQQARGYVSQSSTTASSIPLLPNEKQLNKQNSGMGGR